MAKDRRTDKLLKPNKFAVYHFPYEKLPKALTPPLHTVVVIFTSDFGPITGVARCNASDTFNHRLGQEIALGRAMKEWAEKRKSKRKIVKGSITFPIKSLEFNGKPVETIEQIEFK